MRLLDAVSSSTRKVDSTCSITPFCEYQKAWLIISGQSAEHFPEARDGAGVRQIALVLRIPPEFAPVEVLLSGDKHIGCSSIEPHESLSELLERSLHAFRSRTCHVRLREPLDMIVRFSMLSPLGTIARSFDSCDPCHAIEIDPETLPLGLEILEEEARQMEKEKQILSEKVKSPDQYSVPFVRGTCGFNAAMSLISPNMFDRLSLKN
jgi:hypothetical protein